VLGDRLAVLGPGGRLEQYGTPDAVLAAPASPFVATFLGDEPTLKRLSLHRVADLDLSSGPVVPAGSPADHTRDVAAQAGTDWVAVVDGRRIVGWLRIDDAAPRADPARAHAFAHALDPDTTLRAAVDTLLGAPLQAAVVRRGERDLGVVRLAAILDGIGP
jgi:osmoprotectant transport system ATP-binding protein